MINDRVEFLEKGCPPVNATKMSDEEYERLIELIAVYNRKYPMPGMVMSCVHEGVDRYRGKLYFLEVKCPHCLKTVRYRNMHMNHNRMFKLGCRLRCRECNQQIDLLMFDFYEKHPGIDIGSFERTVKQPESPGTVAIYGAGDRAEYIYQSCMDNAMEVLYFIDNDKKGKYRGLDKIMPEDVHKYPAPDITIIAAASETFQGKYIFPVADNVLWRMKTGIQLETLLYTPLSIIETDNDEEIRMSHYFEYYRSYWMPLLKYYFAIGHNIKEITPVS